MRLTELSPNTFRIALRLDPVMSVHQSIGLNTDVVPLETFSKTSLNISQIRVTFSLSSKQRVVDTCLPSIGCQADGTWEGFTVRFFRRYPFISSFSARVWWTFDGACVVSVMKHSNMAFLDNQVPACLTGNVRRLFLTKGAYQLALFLLELYRVYNTIFHLVQAVIVSTSHYSWHTVLFHTHFIRFCCLSSNFDHPSLL